MVYKKKAERKKHKTKIGGSFLGTFFLVNGTNAMNGRKEKENQKTYIEHAAFGVLSLA